MAVGHKGKNFLPSHGVRFFTFTRDKNSIPTHPPGQEHYSCKFHQNSINYAFSSWNIIIWLIVPSKLPILSKYLWKHWKMSISRKKCKCTGIEFLYNFDVKCTGIKFPYTFKENRTGILFLYTWHQICIGILFLYTQGMKIHALLILPKFTRIQFFPIFKPFINCQN